MGVDMHFGQRGARTPLRLRDVKPGDRAQSAPEAEHRRHSARDHGGSEPPPAGGLRYRRQCEDSPETALDEEPGFVQQDILQSALWRSTDSQNCGESWVGCAPVRLNPLRITSVMAW